MKQRTIVGRGLDAECAHAMGYFPCGCGNPTCDLWAPPVHLDDGGSYSPISAFSSDPAAARLLEDEIERRGLQERYMDALADATDAMPFDDVLYPWALIRATPEQRAQAFLEAVKE